MTKKRSAQQKKKNEVKTKVCALGRADVHSGVPGAGRVSLSIGSLRHLIQLIQDTNTARAHTPTWHVPARDRRTQSIAQ